jgi:hypothetical protein
MSGEHDLDVRALLAASMAAWPHQLTARTADQEILDGHGVRGGKAMIATLQWRPIAIPGQLIPDDWPPEPAAAARPRPASRGPHPATGTARPRLTLRTPDPAPRPGQRLTSREPQEGPQTRTR